MKTYSFLITLFILFRTFSAAAQTPDARFDFSNPESLNPSLAEPQIKEWITLDGAVFTDGAIELSFAASEGGNTHVRLFHSYDAGCDLRLYDGDVMTVNCIDPSLELDHIKFTQSLSGAATGTADINLIPDAGIFVWEDEAWKATSTPVSTLTMESYRQSRITLIEVYLRASSGLDEEAACAGGNDPVFYSITGSRLSGRPSAPGVYIVADGHGTRTVRIIK